MGTEKFCIDSCSCSSRLRPMNAVHPIASFTFVLFLGIVSFPFGSSVPHISSVLENGDDIPGIPTKVVHRGPTVAPMPSPETLKQLELLSRRESGEGFLNAAEAIRNLLSRSSSSSYHPAGKGLKRVSQFHGNGDPGLLGMPNYHHHRPETWEYDGDSGMSDVDENGQPTFVPYIGARALTNIPQFFEHLKENIEALKLSPSLSDEDGESMDSNSNNNGESGGMNDDDELEDRLPKKDSSKPAARRMKTEFHVDEDSSNGSNSWSTKQNWKPRAAGIIHYYAPKANFLEPQQNILRRANNYNPSWLYTNLGLGKRRRRSVREQPVV